MSDQSKNEEVRILLRSNAILERLSRVKHVQKGVLDAKNLLLGL